ncbi:MAG: plasmid pRiA4b ORF-3 family protein [Abitibacteriaceae bacterium]|nr:plasmid pRiA4b ORF-3 family protein [Abditibacteriaceae bacterium]
MPTAPAGTGHSIYQLKVTLAHSKPPIWRRIQVSADMTLYKLHHVLQIVMRRDDSHLHQFVVKGDYYGIPAPDWDLDLIDEETVKLSQLSLGEKAKFIYEYDFGDSWEHQIAVEKILPPDPSLKHPLCIKGKNASPPEDCGGIWGYYEMLEAVQNPAHPEHDHWAEWLEEGFDPAAFDIEDINQRLKKLK